MQQRFWRLLLGLLLIHMLVLLGCQREPSNNSTIDDDHVEIYATIFPLYDIARQIGGENVRVNILTPIGGDSHDFEPSVKEMMAVYDSDIFIYNGAGFETWIEHVVHNLDQSRTRIIDASQTIPNVQPLNEDVEHSHIDDEHGTHDHDHTIGDIDPHIWLDPLNVIAIADQILQTLIEIDPEHQIQYEQNYERYVQQLIELDVMYQETLAKATKKEIVVSHNAYRYLSVRYGFELIPISGLSPSSEPSIKGIQRLIEMMKDHDLQYVAFDAVVQDQVAQTVRRETKAEAVTLYTIENVTKDQFEEGITYLDLMKENLATLKKVLAVHD